MKQGVVFNMLGTGLIVTAVVLHIVCISVPHYAQIDMASILKKWKNIQETSESVNSDNSDISDANTMELDDEFGMDNADNMNEAGNSVDDDMNNVNNQLDLDSGPVEGSHSPDSDVPSIDYSNVNMVISYGLWKFCMSVKLGPISSDTCLTWGSDAADVMKSISGGSADSKDAIAIDAPGWIKGAQAFGIIGVLASVGAAALSILNWLTPSKGDRLRLLHVFILVTCVFAGTVILVGVIIFGANYKNIVRKTVTEKTKITPEMEPFLEMVESNLNLSWAFALDVISIALVLLSGLSHLIGGRATLSEAYVI